MKSSTGLTRRDFARWMAGGICFAGHFARGFAEAAPAGPIRFVNAAPGNGLDFVLRNGAFGRKYQVETLPGGLGVIDFDNDGWPDLYCVNGAALPALEKSDPSFRNRLYRNNRNGTFTDVTAARGRAGARLRDGRCGGRLQQRWAGGSVRCRRARQHALQEQRRRHLYRRDRGRRRWRHRCEGPQAVVSGGGVD